MPVLIEADVVKLKGDKPIGASARMALTDVLAASNGPDFPFVSTEVLQ